MQEPQAMEVDEEENKAFRALVLSMSWLAERDLCSVSTLNTEFLQAARECHLWLPALSKLENIFLHDYVDVSVLEDPTKWDTVTMRIPPRIHGERRDKYSFLPHSRDRAARRSPEPLVLDAKEWGHINDNEKRMNPTTGRLEDRFCRAQDETRVSIWLHRDFPIQCNSCQGVTLNNETEVFHHCARYEHIANAKPIKERIPLAFVDPRHDPEYAAMIAFHKARTMSEYRNMVLKFLRRPMDEAGRAQMSRFAENIKDSVTDLYSDEQYGVDYTEDDYHVALAKCTMERVAQVCVEEFAIKDFLDSDYCGGMDGYCGDVVCRGWGDFWMHGSNSGRHLNSLVSGWSFY